MGSINKRCMCDDVQGVICNLCNGVSVRIANGIAVMCQNPVSVCDACFSKKGYDHYFVLYGRSGIRFFGNDALASTFTFEMLETKPLHGKLTCRACTAFWLRVC